jgi:hypothetical protein
MSILKMTFVVISFMIFMMYSLLPVGFEIV